MPTPQSIVLSDVRLAYDDGPPILHDVTCTIPAGRVGVVGRNGAGKTTLLRLITGELSPTAGSLLVPGEVATVPQDLLQRPDATVAEILGINHIRRAMAAIEAGSVDAADFDMIGSDWDIEARATALLSKRVPSLDVNDVLERTAGTLSGGELVLVALSRLELSHAEVSVLDEPTNNLDATARERLHEAVAEWSGTLLVVSHDVALLNRMDTICEVRSGSLTLWGGNFDDYTEQLAAQQNAAEQAVRAAEQDVRVEQRDRDHMQTAMARRAQKSKKDYANKRAPRIVMKAWANKSEKVMAAERIKATSKVAEAREKLSRAEESMREDDHIRIDIIDPRSAAGRRLAELVGTNQSIHLTGGRRVALVGDNGVGKTSLLRTLLHPEAPVRLPARGELFTRRVGYLDQNLALDDGATIVENIRQAAPTRTPHDIRAQLARFLVRGDMVDRPVAGLSGGERFRVALARILLADPVPELLILDEPTNNLDLTSIDQLVDGLQAYRGAILVVSHDAELLERLSLDEVVRLEADGSLHVL